MSVSRVFDGGFPELVLTPNEQKALEVRQEKGWTYNRINRDLFDNRYRGRQSVAWIVARGKEKLLRQERQKYWAGRAHLCPIGEAPLPIKLRKHLAELGYHTLGDLSRGLKLPKLGPNYEFLLHKLLHHWKVEIPPGGWFCPNCGRGMPSNSGDCIRGHAVRCGHCGLALERLTVPLSKEGGVQVELRYVLP